MEHVQVPSQGSTQDCGLHAIGVLDYMINYPGEIFSVPPSAFGVANVNRLREAIIDSINRNRGTRDGSRTDSEEQQVLNCLQEDQMTTVFFSSINSATVMGQRGHVLLSQGFNLETRLDASLQLLVNAVRNVSNVGSGNSVSVVRVAAEEYLGREVAYRVAFLSDIFMNNVTIAVAPLLGSDGVISIPLLNRRQRERVNEFYGSILHENFEVQFDEENIQGFPESCTLNLKLRLGLNYKLINVSSGRDFIPSNAKVISCCSGIFFEFCIVDNSRKINVIDTPGVRIVVWRTLNENAYFSTVLGEGDFYHHVFFHAALFVKLQPWSECVNIRITTAYSPFLLLDE
jgi:hypothetical protein